MKRILLIGHARHGKDTTAEMLQEIYGYSFKSSSQAAADIFIYETLKDKLGYKTSVECFEDRVNHRKLWHDLICEYNLEDKARLAKEILKTSSMYVGMRSNAEIDACLEQGLFDFVIGVYNYRIPEEPKDSFDINLQERSDFIIPNSGSLNDLRNRIIKLKPLLAHDTQPVQRNIYERTPQEMWVGAQ
jgi:hypothetical protein